MIIVFRRLKRLKYVPTLGGKVKFIIATFFSYVNELHSLNTLTDLQNNLVRGIILCYKDSYFTVPDYSSISFFDPHHEAWFWNLIDIEEGDVVIDVGAHVGKYTIPLGKMVAPEGLVIAIEPHPINFVFLMLNVKINELSDVVRPYNVAAWNQDNASVDLYISSKSELHSVMLKDRAERGSVKVKTRTIDSIVHELKLSKVDLIKIDVEGAEVEVFEGAKNTLQRLTPIIVSEVFRFNFRKFIKLLSDLNYKVYLVNEALNDEQAYVIAKPKS